MVLTLLAIVIFGGLTVWQLVHYSVRPVAIGSPGNGLLLVDRVAGTHEQSGPCGGQPILGPGVPLPRLIVAMPLTAVTICPPVSGPAVTIKQNSPGGQQLLNRFSSAWSIADPILNSLQPVSCTADVHIIGSVVVSTVDTRTLQIAVPIDACQHPQPEAMAAYQAVLDAGRRH